ncbi:hypothetical protein Tco_1504564 [Tanacetum coccineum]
MITSLRLSHEAKNNMSLPITLGIYITTTQPSPVHHTALRRGEQKFNGIYNTACMTECMTASVWTTGGACSGSGGCGGGCGGGGGGCRASCSGCRASCSGGCRGGGGCGSK